MRNTERDLKLSNVLQDTNFIEFLNRVDTELSLTDLVSERIEYFRDNYDLKNREILSELLEFILDEFGYFKDIFDYTVEEILDFCPGLHILNYGEVYNHLMIIYKLS